MSLGASISPGGARAKDHGLEPTQRTLHSREQGVFPLLRNVARVPLTHTGCAVFIGLITPIASLIGPAPVAPIGIDTHGLVSRAYKRELDAFVGVCKGRRTTHQGEVGSVSFLRICLSACPVIPGMSLFLAGPASPRQCPWIAPPVLESCILGALRLGPRSFL